MSENKVLFLLHFKNACIEGHYLLCRSMLMWSINFGRHYFDDADKDARYNCMTSHSIDLPSQSYYTQHMCNREIFPNKTTLMFALGYQ